MSRIGIKPIELPKGTTADIKGKTVSVKGKLGTLSMTIHERIDVSQEDSNIVVKRSSDIKEDRALHGMTRAIIANMVQGVTEGYTKILEIQGIGYRADMKGKKLVLNVGYSNPVEFDVPDGVTLEVDKKNNITITGIDKQQVGQVAADIRAIRPPDSYKGKGVRYRGEIVRLKEGKSGV